MRLIFGAVLLVGVGLAGAAVHMTQNYVEQHKSALKQAQSGPVVRTTPVFVAKRKLKYGAEVTRNDVVIAQWPSNALPKGVFSDIEELFPSDMPGTRYVTRSTEKYEALLAVKLTDPGERIGLRTLLEPGESAFTIKVDVSSGVSGFLRPGDHVDVYWTGRLQDRGKRGQRTVSKLIEPNVRLIAVDQSSNEEVREANIARTITVAVTETQVATLNLMQSTGRLALSLVGERNVALDERIEVDQNEVLGIQEAAAPAPPPVKEKVCTIRTRKGAEVVNIPIPCTN